jgi:Ni/Fe-hydrogenase b-type cytochrome subunit
MAAQEPRHSLTVRLTHWVNAASLLALTISGIGIALAHPRFYWGEGGYFDTPAAFELPIETIKGHTAWGRNLHFLAAWVAVLNGLWYVGWGLYARHFRNRFLPEHRQLDKAYVLDMLSRHLRFRNPSEDGGYNLLQKLTYSGVVFILLPVAILTGLTMSPGFTAAFPQLFTLLGGRQSARTIHFIVAAMLVLFVAIHVAMVFLSGFWRSTSAMITGGTSREELLNR